MYILFQGPIQNGWNSLGRIKQRWYTQMLLLGVYNRWPKVIDVIYWASLTAYRWWWTIIPGNPVRLDISIKNECYLICCSTSNSNGTLLSAFFGFLTAVITFYQRILWKRWYIFGQPRSGIIWRRSVMFFTRAPYFYPTEHVWFGITIKIDAFHQCIRNN